jgi:tetratricopeptide (TPR) repeat protein
MINATYVLLSFSILATTWASMAASDKSPGGGRAATTYAAIYSASFLQNRNAINGVITNTANRPLNRIRVELLDEVEMQIRQTYTDTTGRYSFQNLSTGTFIVRAHSDGTYVGRSVRVSLYLARAGGGAHFEQVDIVLKTRDEAKGSAVPSNSGPAFAQEVPENARRAYERAIRLLENSKDASQGMDALKEAINLFPTYFLALERLGVEYVKLQQYEPARANLTRAVEVNPNGASSHYALGVSQFHLQKLPEAVEALRRSLQLAPESPNAALTHFYLGLAFWNMSKAADAEPHLKKAYQLGGNSIPPDIHLHLAKYYSDNKRYKEAADELELFLKLAPDARDAEKIKNLIKQLRAKAASGAAQQKLRDIVKQSDSADSTPEESTIFTIAGDGGNEDSTADENVIASSLSASDKLGELTLAALKAVKTVELSPADLLREVEKSGAQTYSRLGEYTYSLRKARRVLNSKGKIRSEDYRDYEAYPIKGKHALVQIAENGARLDNTRIDLNRRYATDILMRNDAEMRRLNQTEAAELNRKIGYWGASVEGVVQKRGQPRRNVTIAIDPEALFRSCDFSSPRSTLLEGRETIVMDFNPRAGVRLGQDKDWINNLSGSVWIDAADKSLVRIEGHSAGAQDETSESPAPNFVYQQQRIADGVWAPSLIRINAAGDETIFRGLNWDAWFQFSNYKRFDSNDSDVKIISPEGKGKHSDSADHSKTG